MLDWYQKVFEAKVQYQNPALAFLTYDDEHHRFAFVNMIVLTPNSLDTDANAKVGVNHVGYTFSTVGELLETYERLKRLGITPTGKSIMALRFQLTTEIQMGTAWSFKLTALLTRKRHTRICKARSLLIASELQLLHDNWSLAECFTDRELIVSGRVDFYAEVKRFEISLIRRVLAGTAGNQTIAARILGLKGTTLNAKIRKYRIVPGQAIPDGNEA